MSIRGTSLIELLVGLAVASMVAAIALTSLSMTGIASARQLATARTGDSAWLALAAISRDLRLSPKWNGCVGSTTCTGRNSYHATSALLLDQVTWFAENGLRRCPKDKNCDNYLDGVALAEFIADFPVPEGGTLEIVLWTRDGRRYARTARRPQRAH